MAMWRDNFYVEVLQGSVARIYTESKIKQHIHGACIHKLLGTIAVILVLDDGFYIIHDNGKLDLSIILNDFIKSKVKKVLPIYNPSKITLTMAEEKLGVLFKDAEIFLERRVKNKETQELLFFEAIHGQVSFHKYAQKVVTSLELNSTIQIADAECDLGLRQNIITINAFFTNKNQRREADFIFNGVCPTPLPSLVSDEEIENLNTNLGLMYGANKLNEMQQIRAHLKDDPQLIKAGEQRAQCEKSKDHVSLSLRQAVVLENIDDIFLFLAQGANINSFEDATKNTALHWAVKFEKVIAIRTLLEFGAKTDLKNKSGQTAHELALLSNNRSIKALFEFKNVQEQQVSQKQEEQSSLGL